MSVSFPMRRKRSCVCLAAIILLAAALFNPEYSSAQPLTKVKIGLPDFSISFLSVKVAQLQGLYQAGSDSF